MTLSRNTAIDASLSGWRNSSNETISLADYSLTATGTPLTGDNIDLTYTTIYTIRDYTFNRQTASDIITKLACTRNSASDLTLPLAEQTVLYFGDSGDYISLAIKDGKLCLDSGTTLLMHIQTQPVSVIVDSGLETATLYFESGDTDVSGTTLEIEDYTINIIQGDAHFNIIQGPLVVENGNYVVKVDVSNSVVTMKVSSDGGNSYVKYTTTLTEPFEEDLNAYAGRSNEASRALVDGTLDLSQIRYYKDGEEVYRIRTNEYVGDFGDAITTREHYVINKEYTGNLIQLETANKESFVEAINEVNSEFSVIEERGTFINIGPRNSMLSGHTTSGDSWVANATLTNRHECVTPDVQCCYASANVSIQLELVGAGGMTYETYGSNDPYRDTEEGWSYWHEGGSGAYFKGTFKTPSAGMIKIVTPTKGSETDTGDGGDAVVTFTASGGEEIEIVRAGGGKSGKPDESGKFDVEVDGGTVTYNETYITSVDINEDGYPGKVWKKEYVG